MKGIIKMRVLAFCVRPDEEEFFHADALRLGMEVKLYPLNLSEENADMARGYDGVSCVANCNLSAKVLKKLHECGVKYVSLRTAGYDNVDMETAAALGIRVSKAEYSPYSVANYTVMLILMCVRRGLYIIMRSHAADFSLQEVRGRELQNLTVGIIGAGRIGKAVIENLRGFHCRLLVYTPHPDDSISGVEFVSLEELYGQSDIISLHTYLCRETEHMIDDTAIGKMKEGVVIVNTARGALIDTKALIRGIESGKVGSAGIDCFEGEDGIIRADHNYDQRVTNHDYIILKSFQNTIVTPHVAFYTDQSVEDMVGCSLENLQKFYEGKAVTAEVSAFTKRLTNYE